MDTNFTKLAAINVSDKIEKKNGLSYLSWAVAVDQLLRADPAASWSYGMPMRWNDTVMVNCTVIAFGKPMTMQLPVMDYKNKAISNPDAFAVNTAMQRCLVKAIALHGLGLYIYAGEDLPEAPEAKPVTDMSGKPQDGMRLQDFPQDRQIEITAWSSDITKFFNAGDVALAAKTWKDCDLPHEEKAACWIELDAHTRTSIRKFIDRQKAA